MRVFLTWRGIPFRKTHDFGEISRQCVDVDAALNSLCARAERLSVYAWIFRYPGDLREPPAVEAREALACAGRLRRCPGPASSGRTVVSQRALSGGCGLGGR